MVILKKRAEALFLNTLMSLQLISVTYYLSDINIYLRRIEMSSEQFLAYALARQAQFIELVAKATAR